jgi:hypothetical protein
MRNLGDIRATYERGEGSLKELAQRFDVPYSTLTRRCFGEEWRKPRGRRGVAQMSVQAFAYVNGFWLTRHQSAEIGRLAQAMCLAQKSIRGIKDDDQFGIVITYPVVILASIFADEALWKSAGSAGSGDHP